MSCKASQTSWRPGFQIIRWPYGRQLAKCSSHGGKSQWFAAYIQRAVEDPMRSIAPDVCRP